MKKAIIIVIIVSLICVSITYFMIEKKIQDNTLDVSPPIEDALISDNDDDNSSISVSENVNDDIENISDTNDSIVDRKEAKLGETIYTENPITVSWIKDGEKYNTKHWDADYVEISGLKDINLQDKINQYMKNNGISDVTSNFSNFISATNNYNYSEDKVFYNVSLVDGRELSINDFFYDKNELKSILPKYLAKGIQDAFSYGTYFGDLLTNSRNLSYYSDDQIKVFNSELSELKAEEAKFNSMLESWELKLINKFDSDAYRFFFRANDNLTYFCIYFDDLNFINPSKQFTDGYFNYFFTTWYEPKVSSVMIEIPFYEIYKYFSIFDQKENVYNLYENPEKSTNGLVGFHSFDVVNKDFVYKTYNDDDLKLLNQMYGSKEKVENNKNKWNKIYNELLEKKDKKIIAYNMLLYSQSYGPYIFSFYAMFNKSSNNFEKEDIYKSIMKSFDVLYQSEAIDKIKNTLIDLKNKYNDFEYYTDYDNVADDDSGVYTEYDF